LQYYLNYHTFTVPGTKAFAAGNRPVTNFAVFDRTGPIKFVPASFRRYYGWELNAWPRQKMVSTMDRPDALLWNECGGASMRIGWKRRDPAHVFGQIQAV